MKLSEIESRFFAKPRIVEALVFIMLFFIFFNRLGVEMLYIIDDTFHAGIVKRFVQSGDVFQLEKHIGGAFFEKPPLWIILSSLGMKLFGFTTIGGKSVLTFYCFVSLLIGYYIIKRHNGIKAALLVTIIAGTTQQILFFSRRLGTDGVLAASLYIALLFFYYAHDKKRYYYGFGFFLGLAFMSKGVAALVPLAGIFIYMLSTQEGRARFRSAHLYFSILPFLVVVLPWHIGMYIIHENEFIQSYVWGRQLSYFFPDNVHSGESGWGWETNLKKIIENYWPYLPFFLYAAYRLMADIAKKRWRDNAFDVRLYSFLWAIGIILIYQIASVKRYVYILPAYHAMALFTGVTMRLHDTRWIYRFFALTLAIFFIVSFTPLWDFMNRSIWEKHRPIIEKLSDDGAHPPGFTIYPPRKPGQLTWLYDGYFYYTSSFSNVDNSKPAVRRFYDAGGAFVFETKKSNDFVNIVGTNYSVILSTNRILLVRKRGMR
jgi:4-amino-4-deoxy-L-arabinose transferase-like glycosyltransferase